MSTRLFQFANSEGRAFGNLAPEDRPPGRSVAPLAPGDLAPEDRPPRRTRQTRSSGGPVAPEDRPPGSLAPEGRPPGRKLFLAPGDRPPGRILTTEVLPP